MIFGLLAGLLVPLPSLTEGKKVKGLCFLRYKQPNKKKTKNELFNNAKGKYFQLQPIDT